MPTRKHKFQKGFIDPLSLISISVLAVSLVAGIIYVKKPQNINEKAAQTAEDSGTSTKSIPITTTKEKKKKPVALPNTPTPTPSGYDLSQIVNPNQNTPNTVGYNCANGGCPAGVEVSGFYKAPNGKYYPIAQSAGGPSNEQLEYINQKSVDTNTAITIAAPVQTNTPTPRPTSLNALIGSSNGTNPFIGDVGKSNQEQIENWYTKTPAPAPKVVKPTATPIKLKLTNGKACSLPSDCLSGNCLPVPGGKVCAEKSATSQKVAESLRQPTPNIPIIVDTDLQLENMRNEREIAVKVETETVVQKIGGLASNIIKIINPKTENTSDTDKQLETIRTNRTPTTYSPVKVNEVGKNAGNVTSFETSKFGEIIDTDLQLEKMRQDRVLETKNISLNSTGTGNGVFTDNSNIFQKIGASITNTFNSIFNTSNSKKVTDESVNQVENIRITRKDNSSSNIITSIKTLFTGSEDIQKTKNDQDSESKLGNIIKKQNIITNSAYPNLSGTGIDIQITQELATGTDKDVIYLTKLFNDYNKAHPLTNTRPATQAEKDAFIKYLKTTIGANKEYSHILTPQFDSTLTNYVSRFYGYYQEDIDKSQLVQCVGWQVVVDSVNPSLDLVDLSSEKLVDAGSVFWLSDRAKDETTGRPLNGNKVPIQQEMAKNPDGKYMYYMSGNVVMWHFNDVNDVQKGDTFVYGKHTGSVMHKYTDENGNLYFEITEANSPKGNIDGTPVTYIVDEAKFNEIIGLEQTVFLRPKNRAETVIPSESLPDNIDALID